MGSYPALAHDAELLVAAPGNIAQSDSSQNKFDSGTEISDKQ